MDAVGIAAAAQVLEDVAQGARSYSHGAFERPKFRITWGG